MAKVTLAELREIAETNPQGYIDVFGDNDPLGLTPTLRERMKAPPANDQQAEGSSILRRAVADPALSLAKGVIAVPEAVVGLADIPTLGYAGKAAEAVGIRFKDAKDALTGMMSPEARAAQQTVNDAEGVVDTTVAAVQNPSTIVGGVAESVPLIGAGGVVGRGLLAIAPRLGLSATAGRVLAGAGGEGVVGVGNQAEGIRQQTADGTLTPKQAGLSAVSGAATSLFGVVGQKTARALGIVDVDALAAGAAGPAVTQGFVRRVLEGALTEGALEELPQSISEQVLQNAALDKPLDEGVDTAAVLGLLTGSLMGAGTNALQRPGAPAAVTPPAPGLAAVTPPAPPSAAPKKPRAPKAAPAATTAPVNQPTVASTATVPPAPVATPAASAPTATVVNPTTVNPPAAEPDLENFGNEDLPADVVRREFLTENGYTEGGDGSISTKDGQVAGPELDRLMSFLADADDVSQQMEAEGLPVTPQTVREELRRRQKVLDLQGDLATAQTPETKAIVQKQIDAASAGRTAPAGDLEALAREAEARGDKDTAKAYQEAVKEITDGAVADQGGESGSRDVERGMVDSAGAGSVPSESEPASTAAGIPPAGAAPVALGSGAGEQAAGVADQVAKLPLESDSDWEALPPETGTLGIPRAEMPQIKAEHRGAMVNFLNARGVAHEIERNVDPAELKPTQAEYSKAKVEQARGFEGGDRAILVSSDGHVVDGHHQWLAAQAEGKPIKVIKLDAPARDLLPLLNEFPSSQQDAGLPDADAVSQPEPKKIKAAKKQGSKPAVSRLKAFQNERLTDERVRSDLEAMAGQAGWAQIGGEMIRAAETGESGKRTEPGELKRGDGEVVGRTQWIPNAPWFKAAQSSAPLIANKNGKATQEAVRRALAGEPMTVAQKRHVEVMLQELDALDAEAASRMDRYGEEFDAALSTAAASKDRSEDSVDNEVPAINYALVQTATEIDEAAVERAAVKAGDDDAAFMAAVQEIIDGRVEGARADRASGEVGEDLQADADREESGRSEEGRGREAEGLTLTAQSAPPVVAKAQPRPSTDLFGAVPVAQQAIADRQREQEASRNGTKDVPAGVDGGLFSDRQKQRDIADAPPKSADLGGQLAAMSDADLEALIDDVAHESRAAESEKPQGKRSGKTKAPKSANPAEPKLRKPRAVVEKASQPADEPRTVAEIAGSLGVNLSSAGQNALTGLTKLFGTSGKVSAGLTFDEDTYRQAKPYFQALLRDFQAAGKDIRDLIRELLNMLGTGAKPYILRFAQDLREGKNDAPVPGSDLERNREVAADPASAVESDDADGSGRDGDGVRSESERTGEERGIAESGAGLLADGPAADGKRVDLAVHPVGAPLGAADLPAGADIDPRGGGFGDAGVPVEPASGTGTRSAATPGLSRAAKLDRQRRADREVTDRPGDLENVRDALPYLLEGQQEDVHKAEQRFAKSDGFGMLFTNGTGTGKTFTGLGVVKRFANRGKTNTLIIAPNDKIMADWIESAKALNLTVTALESTADAGKGITIATYANVGSNDALATRAFDLVVADEAHYLMQSESGEVTGFLEAVRAHTMHPDGAFKRADMLHGDLLAKAKSLSQAAKLARMSDDQREWANIAGLEKQEAAAWAAWKAKQDEVRADVAARQGAARPRAMFLSATPFAYEKTVDWANGYLFDYDAGMPKDETGRGYNGGSNRERFFMQHFGYRMRYNKLTQPDAKVDSGLMQRQFNSWLKREGVLSSRLLDVAADYDRKFVLVESAIGTDIDAAFEWLREKAHNHDSKAGALNPYYAILEAIDDKFDYLSRRYLLEAIKAQESVAHVKAHMALGRKVVVFHDYKKGGGFNPFDVKISSIEPGFGPVLAEFRSEFKSLVNAPLGSFPSPIDTYRKEFPGVLLFNGDIPPKQRRANVEKFQDDASGPVVILVQSAAGKEGISLHDTTGKHQRALLNLGQPTQPTTAIQQEGRTYRTGQVTDAIFRYFNTGTSWERWAFATTIAGRASAAENLSAGEQARALRDAFITGFEESGDYPAGHEGEGKGGKERDKAANNALTEYDRARAFYFGTAKKNSKTKAQEGKDYFATPEPVGLKMVQWADLRPGETALEPSGGHGAIARWLPESTERTVIEPSTELASRLAMVFDGKLIRGTFEAHNVVNKYDGIVMNPPFGVGGKTAIDHLAKAATHLREGGRIVALIPTGPAADKRFDKWFYEEDTRKASPLYTDEKLGPVYEGDTLTAGPQLNGLKIIVGHVDKQSDGRRTVRPKGEPVKSGVWMGFMSEVTPGARTTTFKPAEGLYLAANIKLPQVTFERAGTQVATRIVVLEKPIEGQAAPQEQTRDLSDIDDIGKLFDRLENLDIRPRSKPLEAQEEGRRVAEKAAKPKPTAAAAEDIPKIARGDRPIIEYETKKGRTIRGAIFKDLTKEQAEAVDKYTWKTGGGFFIREKHLIDEAPMANRAAARRGLPEASAADVKQAQHIVDAVTSTWANKPTIKVLASMQDQAAPEAARLMDAEQKAGGAIGEVAGFIYQNQVYINAAASTDPRQILKTLYHESLGHFGLRAVFGPQLAEELKKVALLRAKDVMAKLAEYGMEDTPKNRLKAAEEVLARLAESDPQLGIVKRVLGIIRSVLRPILAKVGIKMDLSDAELIRDYLEPAREFVRRGDSKSAPDAVLAFSRTEDSGKKIALLREAVERVAAGAEEAVAVGLRPDLEALGGSPDVAISWGNAKYGLSKIGARRGAEVVGRVLRAVAVGTIERHSDAKKTVLLAHEGGRAVLSLDENGKRKTWLLTGWEEGRPDAAGEVRTQSGATQTDPTFGRADLVAGLDEMLPPSSPGDNSTVDFSRNAHLAQTWQMPADSRIDSFVHAIQDKNVDLKAAIRAITDAGRTVADGQNAYQVEELSTSRKAAQAKDFMEREVKPILQLMNLNGVKLEQLEEYLHARHAEEANQRIADINPGNPDLQDGGSGMTTADAQAYLAALSPDELRRLNIVARRLDALQAETRQYLVDTGLETAETVAEWEATYQHYVPLMREGFEDKAGRGGGQGISAKGAFAKSRLGSKRQVVDIFANIVMAREKAITRAENARVGRSLLGLAIQNENPNFWLPVNPDIKTTPARSRKLKQELQSMGLNPADADGVAKEPVQRYLNPQTGLVESRINPALRNRDNVIAVRVNGKDRFVFLSESDPRAVRMAKALKNLDANQMSQAMRMIGSVTRFFAAVNTQFNVVFGQVNFLRDVQSAMLNLGDTPIKGRKAAVANEARRLYVATRGGLGTMSKLKGPDAALWQRFREAGGTTGFRDVFPSSTARTEAIKLELDPSSWADGGWGKVFSANGTLKVPLDQARKLLAPTFKWISEYNEALENVTRLAAFKVALDSGMSEQKAASLAKNLTANFNRRGDWSQTMGAFYAFFNAGVQGSARIGQALIAKNANGDLRLSSFGKTVVLGGVSLGILQALALAAAGYSDDEPPEFVRERNLILPDFFTGSGKYVTIPMPLGWHVLPNLGRKATQLLLNGGDGKADAVIDMLRVSIDAFNPLGSSTVSQMLSPTAADPIVALSENADFTGRPIAREDRSGLDPTPGYTRGRDSSSFFGESIAYALNLMSGGTDYTPGKLSPTPDQIDYLAGQVGGGVAREIIKGIDTVSGVASGTEVPIYRVPLLGRFVGSTTGQASESDRFYRNVTKINLAEREALGRKGDGKPIADYLKDHPEAQLGKLADRAQREITKLKKQKREVLAAGAPLADAKQYDEAITGLQKRVNQAVAQANR